MPEQNQNPFAPFFDEVRKIVREEIAAALANGQKPLTDKEWLKADELAELYGMPKTWFEERGRAGDIARTKPGRYVLFKRRDVEEFLEKNKST
jgi:excisionase family DNA binding protein